MRRTGCSSTPPRPRSPPARQAKWSRSAINYGALTLGAAAAGTAGIRTHQDALSGELALAANADQFGLGDAYRSLPLGADLLAGARVVLLRMPRSLDALEEIADAIARHALPEVTVYAAGMVKHMALAMNEVLARRFDDVHAGLARQKARVIVATGSHAPAAVPEWPRREFHEDLGLWVCAHGGAFAGTRIDIGTRFLLGFLDRAKPDATSAVDLGCGTGVLAAALAPRGRTCASWPPTSRRPPSPPPPPPPRPTGSPTACACSATTVLRISRMPRPN